ncbi:MAG: PadR family transcriptional regulator [Methanomassiliicoccales archaeon]|nr:PadR family transcriptional regulator [Methanomassiliicoccales archaeon]
MMGKVHVYKGNRISPSQLIMMVLLQERPMYGYEVLKSLREKYEGVWEPQTGSVYPALRRLQEHGLLDVKKTEGKDHYSLSEEGSAWLEEKLTALSSGVLYMSRTMEILGLAAKKNRETRAFVPLDEEPLEKQLAIIKEMHEAMQNNLQMIEEHIAELEKEMRN